jgi:hypothetical protein
MVEELEQWQKNKDALIHQKEAPQMTIEKCPGHEEPYGKHTCRATGLG